MTVIEIRLPDDAAERLKMLAKSRGRSIDGLVEEMSRQAISIWDAEFRFRALAASADRKAALAVLDRLHADDGN